MIKITKITGLKLLQTQIKIKWDKIQINNIKDNLVSPVDQADQEDLVDLEDPEVQIKEVMYSCKSFVHV